MTTFRFAGWNPKRGTVPAYRVDKSSDQITAAEIIIGADGEPVDAGGLPLKDDGITRSLVGWPHRDCQSFADGSILIPLRRSNADGT